MKEYVSKHLKEQEMTYFQHLAHALKYSSILAVCSFVLIFMHFFLLFWKGLHQTGLI